MDALAAALALPVGLSLADLVSAVAHWLGDTYFYDDTPVLGAIVGPFRLHHRDPDAFRRHTFWQRNRNHFLAALPLLTLAAFLLPRVSATGHTFAGAALAVAVIALAGATQIHAWAHDDDDAPKLVEWLQRAGILLSRARHARHHRGAHDGSYGIVNGWTNPALDRIHFFRHAERWLARLGLRPASQERAAPASHAPGRTNDLRASASSTRGVRRWRATMAALVTAIVVLGMGAALRFDWFLVDLLLLSAIYVPLERRFPRVAQPILRRGIGTDFGYFFVNHVLLHVILFLSIAPAVTLLAWARLPLLVAAVASQPVALQFVEMVVVADLSQYGVHRLFHAIPFLWRIHAVHHSSKQLDWLAGSRLHLVDVVVVRAATLAPLFVLGFSDAALRAYAVYVAAMGAFLHANVRFRFGVLEKLVVTPRYHAFHHAAESGAIDKNFAFHLPILDRLFGTHYMPERAWPNRYGVVDGRSGSTRRSDVDRSEGRMAET